MLPLLVNSAVLLGTTLLVMSFWRATLLDRLLASAVAGFTAIVLSLELLSVVGQIRPGPVAALSAGLLIAGLASARRFGVAGTSRTGSDGDPGPPRPQITPSRAVPAAAALAGIAAAWAALDYLVYGVLAPVLPVSDAPIYHLPFALRWWQAGTLELVPTPFGEEAATYFPANGELWLAWILASGAGGAVVKVGQWPFLILGAAAVYALARQQGSSAGAAVLPAACWTCAPLGLAQSSLANVDLIWTAYYLIAVHFALRYGAELRAGRPGHGALLWAALSAGIVLGTKSVGLLFVALLPLALLGPRSGDARRRIGSAGYARYVLLLVGGLALPCAYWFARNALLAGNPVYPLEVSAFGQPLLTGWYDRSAMLATSYHVPPEHWPWFVQRFVLVAGPLLAGAWALGVVTALAAGVLQLGQRATRPAVVLPAALAVLHCAVYWYVVPYNTQERFLLPALGLGVVPLASLIDGRPWLGCSLAVLLAAGVLGVPAAAGSVAALPMPLRDGLVRMGLPWLAVVLPLALTLGVLVWTRLPRGGAALAPLLVIGGCMLSAAPLAASLVDEPLRGFYPRGGFAERMRPAWILVEQAAGPDGTRVAYAGTNLPYYLYGTELRNEVRYVNVNAHVDWLPHDYHRARLRAGQRTRADDPWPQWYRTAADFEAWLANLRRAEIRLLVVARENRHGRLGGPEDRGEPPFPIEKQWADAHPHLFEPLGPHESETGDRPWACVYRLKPQTSAAAGPAGTF